MKHIIDILLENGYKVKLGSFPNFSTMVKNGTRCLFEDNKGNSVIWGLNEFKKPPTLCYPRPKISLTTEINGEIVTLNETSDDAMNYCLSKENHQFIFDNLFTGYKFKYDTTKNPTE